MHSVNYCQIIVQVLKVWLDSFITIPRKECRPITKHCETCRSTCVKEGAWHIPKFAGVCTVIGRLFEVDVDILK